jgi:hypothetical protein
MSARGPGRRRWVATLLAAVLYFDPAGALSRRAAGPERAAAAAEGGGQVLGPGMAPVPRSVLVGWERVEAELRTLGSALADLGWEVPPDGMPAPPGELPLRESFRGSATDLAEELRLRFGFEGIASEPRFRLVRWDVQRVPGAPEAERVTDCWLVTVEFPEGLPEPVGLPAGRLAVLLAEIGTSQVEEAGPAPFRARVRSRVVLSDFLGLAPLIAGSVSLLESAVEFRRAAPLPGRPEVEPTGRFHGIETFRFEARGTTHQRVLLTEAGPAPGAAFEPPLLPGFMGDRFLKCIEDCLREFRLPFSVFTVMGIASCAAGCLAATIGWVPCMAACLSVMGLSLKIAKLGAFLACVMKCMKHLR